MNAADISSLEKEGIMQNMPDYTHPALKLKPRKKKWAQAATARMEQKGTVGSETRMAHAAGQSPMGFARANYNAPGKVGAKARFAVNLNGGR